MSRVIEKTLPEGWLETTIENSCEILDKLRKPISQKNRTNGEYPYYGATGIVDYINNYIFDERLVLVGEDGAKWERGDKTGFIAEGKYWVNNHAHVLRVNEDILIDKWLVNFLCFSDLSDYITGTTVPKLNQAKLKSIEFPLPPLEEQKRIVAKIDTLFAKIDKAISLTEDSLKQAKNLLPSVLKEVFEKGKADGWEEKKLEEVLEKTNNVNPKTSSFDEFTYIDISAVDKSLQEIVLPKTVKSIDAPSRAKKSIELDDILFATTRPNLKNIAIVSELYDFPIASTGFCVVRSNSEAHNRYLFYYLISDLLQEQIKPFIRGAQYPAVSDKDLKSVLIPVPNLKEQIQASALFDKISDESKQSQSKLEEQLAYLKQLKSSILSKAFKGEL
jgi:type I restriction enzyme S subunit